MKLASRIYKLIMAHRIRAALLLLILTAGVTAGAYRLKFNNSYRIWFVEDDPALVAYDEFLKRFGSDEAMILAVDTRGKPFSLETLKAVKKLSDALSKKKGVIDVWSLTHMEAMVDAGGSIAVRKLIDRVPPKPKELTRAKALVRTSPLYQILLSKDKKTTAVILTLEITKGSFDPKARLVRSVRALTARLLPDRKVWISGSPVLDEAVYRYSEEDTLRYGPIMAGIIILALGWLFRSAVAVVIPLLVVFLSIGWAVGLMGWVNWEANIITTVLPPMLCAVGIADSIHFLQHFRLSMRKGAAPPEATRLAFINMLRPCFLTSITTAAGMASFVAASLPAMRELGLTAALGVMAAFLLTMIGIPLAFSVLPDRWLAGMVRRGGSIYPHWLVRLSDIAITHSRKVIALTVAVAALAVVGLTRIDASTSLISYFYEKDPVYQESLMVDRALGGAFPLQVLINARGKRDLLEPDALSRIEKIGAYLETLPATGRAISAVDFLKEARRVFLGKPPGKLALPKNRREAAQILLMLESEDMARFLSFDYRQARVEVAVAATRYQELVSQMAKVESRLAELGGDALNPRVTGLARLLSGMEEYLFKSQAQSFGLAFLLVIGFIAILFWSARVGVLSAIPNLLPILITLGLMGWTEVRLDATTIMIAPLLLGIVVDDTVHVLERVLIARQDGLEVPQAFQLSINEVGHAVLLTTIILAFGFLTPVLGSFKPNLYFALLSAFALVLALLADIVVFPAVACLAPKLVPSRKKKSGLRMGQENKQE